MRKRYFLSFLIFMVLVSIGAGSGFSQNTKATAEQEAQAQKILNKLSVLLADKYVDFIYSKLEYDRSEDKYTFTDLRPAGSNDEKAPNKVENKVEIQNFSESSDNEEFKIGWMSARFKDTNPPGHTKRTPPEFAFIFSDIEGSSLRNIFKIDKTQVVILAGKSKKQQDLSGVTLTMDDFKIESLNKIKDFGAFLKGLKGRSPEDYFLNQSPEKVLENLISYVSFDKLTVNGFPEELKPNGSIIKLGKVQVNNLRNGIVDNIEINDFYGKTPNDPKFRDVRMDRASVEKVDLIRMMKISAKNKYRNKGTPPSIEDIEDILKVAQGFSIKGVEMTGPSGFLAIRHFDFNWKNFIGPFPTKINLSGDISVQTDERDEKNARFLEMLEALGIDIMNMKFDIRMEWNEENNALIIKPFFYDVDQLVAVNFSAELTNISKAMLLEKDPKKMLVLAMGANIGEITLKISDKGVLRLLDEKTRMQWDLMKEQFALDPNLAPIIEDLNRFLEKPQGTFEAVMKPRGPVNFAQLAAMGKMGPNVIFTLFDVKTQYLGKSRL